MESSKKYPGLIELTEAEFIRTVAKTLKGESKDAYGKLNQILKEVYFYEQHGHYVKYYVDAQTGNLTYRATPKNPIGYEVKYEQLRLA